MTTSDGRLAADSLSGVAGRGEQSVGLASKVSVEDPGRLVDHGLDGVLAIDARLLGPLEHDARTDQRNDDAGLPSESRNLRPLRSTSITPTMVTRKFTAVRIT